MLFHSSTTAHIKVGEIKISKRYKRVPWRFPARGATCVRVPPVMTIVKSIESSAISKKQKIPGCKRTNRYEAKKSVQYKEFFYNHTSSSENYDSDSLNIDENKGSLSQDMFQQHYYSKRFSTFNIAYSNYLSFMCLAQRVFQRRNSFESSNRPGHNATGK